MINQPPREHLVRDQISGAVIDRINTFRHDAEAIQQAIQDRAFSLAQDQVNKIRDFIGTPENILGNPSTKHGEIAEQVEVGIQNARSAVNQEAMKATFEGVGRTARADYLIDGIDVQSKFYNGARNSLDGILSHLEKYPDFTEADGYYHIPKDQHADILKLLSGEQVGDLNKKTIRAIQEKVEEIERQTGQSFGEVIRPGVSAYSEVQQGAIHETLDGYDEELGETNQRRQEDIQQDHQASLAEGLKATGIAAGIAGGLTLGTALYGKYREGKNPFKGDFKVEDWADVGVKTAKGAAGGAIAGASLYALTNYAGMGAPFASAMVSSAKGIASLSQQLQQGDINADQFIDLGMVVCSEAAIVALATVAGQTAIPIPILGSLVGSIAGRMLAEAVTDTTNAVAERLEADMKDFLGRVDAEHQTLVGEIHAEFDALGSLMEAAFMIELNYGLRERSLALAEALEVPNELLIHSEQQLDDFMLS